MNRITIKDDHVTEIQHIYHLSDIHIKNDERHDEYAVVFERTYKKLKKEIKDKNALIVLTGDIMDYRSDNNLAAGLIASNFFKTLSSIAPTIMIAGNHDCKVSDDQEDILTKI